MKKIVSDLNAEIDQQNVEQIDALLNQLDDPIELEGLMIDSELFAKRIIDEQRSNSKNNDRNNERNYNKEGANIMQAKLKRSFPLVASLLLAFVLGVTVHATGLFNVFSFYGESTTVEVRTDQEISQEDMESLVEETVTQYESGEASEEIVVDAEYVTYESVSKVEDALGLSIVLPTYIPQEFQLMSDVVVSNGIDGNHNIYLTYSSENSEDQMIGVTLATQIYDENSTVVSITDTVYKDDYVSSKGEHFTVLNEDGGLILTAELGHLQYALIFFGIDEDEVFKVADSLELDIYR